MRDNIWLVIALKDAKASKGVALRSRRAQQYQHPPRALTNPKHVDENDQVVVSHAVTRLEILISKQHILVLPKLQFCWLHAAHLRAETIL
jgi:hypothetical protein